VTCGGVKLAEVNFKDDGEQVLSGTFSLPANCWTLTDSPAVQFPGGLDHGLHCGQTAMAA